MFRSLMRSSPSDSIRRTRTARSPLTPHDVSCFESLERRVVMDGVPVVTVAMPDRTAHEEAEEQGVFIIKRTGSLEEPLDVRYTLSGSAENGIDYLGLAEQVRIPAGRRQVRIPVVPIDDLDVEGNEYVRLELLSHTDYVLDNSASVNRARTITLEDGDRYPLITVVARDARSAEFEENNARFNIRREGPAELSLTVNFIVSGTAAMGTDYATIPSSVTFAPGQRVASIIVTPYEDELFEGEESVRITLQEGARMELSDDFSEVTASVRIEDKPLVSLWVEDPVASSFPDDTGVIVLRRTGRLNSELDVQWSASGSAVKHTHYEALPSVLTFERGERELRIDVRGVGAHLTADKLFTMTLLTNRRYSLDTIFAARTSATVRIVNDGGPVV